MFPGPPRGLREAFRHRGRTRLRGGRRAAGEAKKHVQSQGSRGRLCAVRVQSRPGAGTAVRIPPLQTYPTRSRASAEGERQVICLLDPLLRHGAPASATSEGRPHGRPTNSAHSFLGLCASPSTGLGRSPSAPTSALFFIPFFCSCCVARLSRLAVCHCLLLAPSRLLPVVPAKNGVLIRVGSRLLASSFFSFSSIDPV